jgi:hypothetical protein
VAFTEQERTDVRRHCGYPAYGAGESGFQGWRFFKAYGLLEFRLSNLSAAEEAVVRTYLGTLATLETAVPAAADNLDTAAASVWTHNAHELRERLGLLDGWRRRLCGFLGIPTGPALSDGGIRLVV